MIFSSKFVIGTTVLAGLGTPCYLFFKNYCPYTKSSIFWKRAFNVSESVLECKGNGKDYSVFLAFKEPSDSTANSQEVSFKVVDNNDQKKVKWGLGGSSSDQWTEWGIAIKNSGGGGTEIRVPTKGNVYRRGSATTISCQKSLLQLKVNSNGTPCKGGGVLRSPNMKFKINNGNVEMTNKFNWKDGFKPREIFCSSL